jgi:hypothetical protein
MLNTLFQFVGCRYYSLEQRKIFELSEAAAEIFKNHL